jgi:hypothetical protein
LVALLPHKNTWAIVTAIEVPTVGMGNPWSQSNKNYVKNKVFWKLLSSAPLKWLFKAHQNTHKESSPYIFIMMQSNINL